MGGPFWRAGAGQFSRALKRDEGWKAFYAERMEAVKPSGVTEKSLRIFSAELEAERLQLDGEPERATERIQQLLDGGDVEDSDKGWYLQEMARISYVGRREESSRLQAAAYRKNKLLLKPRAGVQVAKLTVVSEGRMERIIEWVRTFGDYEQLYIAVTDVLSNLAFGVDADRFERAFDELAFALGFKGERPDREWKEGPDNLWALDDQRYLVCECKSKVDVQRAEIHKRESEQMNRSCAWFDKHYSPARSRNVMIVPTRFEPSAAAFTHEVWIMRVAELGRLTRNVQAFFRGFASLDIRDLSRASVQEMVNATELSTEDLWTKYGKRPRRKS